MAAHDPDLLTFDEAESLGLDGTGRDFDPRFPFRWTKLTDEERRTLLNAFDKEPTRFGPCRYEGGWCVSHRPAMHFRADEAEPVTMTVHVTLSCGHTADVHEASSMFDYPECASCPDEVRIVKVEGIDTADEVDRTATVRIVTMHGLKFLAAPNGCLCGIAHDDVYVVGGDCRSLGCHPCCPVCAGPDDVCFDPENH